MSETIVVPDNGNNNNGWNSPLGYLAMGGNNNGFLGGNGLGAGVVGFILGALINNNGNGIFGNGGNNNGAAAASLGAQATANANAEMVMNAINGTDADVRLLATTLNSDMDSVRLAINTVQGAVAQVGNTVGMTGLQVINAIQAGDAALASQLCQCCCQTQQSIMQQGYENQIATLNQTNSLNTTINANGQRNVDAIADLKSSMISEFCAARERDMQAKIDTQAEIITQLRNAADNANQTNQIAAMIAPLQAKLVAIENRQPNTVSVPYPQLSVVNTTPYMGGFYGNGFYGNGFGNNIVF